MAAVAPPSNVTATVQRNRPGTKNKDLFAWGSVSLESMESTFGAQQYIQQLIRADPNDVENILKVPEGTDEAVWQYEHLRQFTLEFNQLVVLFDPVCNEVRKEGRGEGEERERRGRGEGEERERRGRGEGEERERRGERERRDKELYLLFACRLHVHK